MRELLGAGTSAAKEAIEIYCYRARKYVGAYLAVLGGADAILFGGGVGEHAHFIRQRILEDLDWAGIVLDLEANEVFVGSSGRFDASDGNVELHVIAVDEAAEMVRQALPLLPESRY